MAGTHELSQGALPASRPGALYAPSWPLVIGLAVYAIFLRHAGMLLLDGDTSSHVAAGRWMIAHWRVPSGDPFSYTVPGAPWTAQEWLSQVILAATHAAGGWPAVTALTAFVCALTIAVFARAMLRWVEPQHALLLGMMGALMIGPHVLARPHMIAMPFVVIWTNELVVAAEDGRAPRWWMLPLMTLWANLHGGFTLGLMLAGPIALEALLRAREQGRLPAAARIWGIFLALAVACALLTPNGFKGILFTWQVLVQDKFALERIGEWQSPDFHQLQPLELWLLGGLAIALLHGIRLPALRVVLLLGLIHLALKHLRSIELLGLLGPLFIAAPFAKQWRARQAAGGHFTPADRFFAALARRAGAGAVLATFVAAAAATIVWSRVAPVEMPEKVAPSAALRAAREHGLLPGRVLNAYAFGGFLIEQGVPVFIDGRSDMYRDAFIKPYMEALTLTDPQGLELLIDRYGVTWTMLDPRAAAIAVLDRLPGWRRVYEDKYAVIHAKVPAAAKEARP